MAVDPSLGLGEKLGLFFGVVSLVIYGVFTTVAVPFRNRTGRRSWRHERRNRTARYLMSTFSIRQLPHLFPNTNAIIRKFCRTTKVPHQAEAVSAGAGAIVHWIGNRKAPKVIVYMHGGGFGLSPNSGHLKFLRKCQDRLAKAGKEAVLAFIEYGLTPGTQYPTQYVQALESLRFIINSGYEPADILLGGDSAGGNIVLAILSLIQHPLPLLPQLSLKTPLSGVFLISPWTSFSSDSSTYKENAHKDIIFPQQMHDWADAFVPLPMRNEYCEPARASADWWKDTPARRVLTVCGSDEVFREDIQVVGAKFKEAGVNAMTVTCAKQIHVECILDEESLLAPGDMSYVIWDWLATAYT